MVVSVAHQPDLDAYKDTYSKFRSLAADATETYNGSLTYGIQPFSSSAVDQSNQNGGCPLGLKQIGQDCKQSLITLRSWRKTFSRITANLNALPLPRVHRCHPVER